MARILVVDDDDLVRKAIAFTLLGAKHDVSEASNGQQALDILDGGAVDIVVSDILMPEMDGIGLILAIGKRHPNVRILCISGGGLYGNIDYLAMAGKLGAQMILPKPFTPKELLAAVEAVMSMPVPPGLDKK